MQIRPIRSEADHDAALREIEQLWGAREGTPKSDRLEVLTTLVEAYERDQYPIDPPDRRPCSGLRGVEGRPCVVSDYDPPSA